MCRYNADRAKKTRAVPMASAVGDPVTSNSKAISTLLNMGPADLETPNPPQCPAQAAGTRPTCDLQIPCPTSDFFDFSSYRFKINPVFPY